MILEQGGGGTPRGLKPFQLPFGCRGAKAPLFHSRVEVALDRRPRPPWIAGGGIR